MPVMPSPSYHKYDVTDYMAVDGEYGTLKDMRDLAAACRERGIALIVDMPVNHTSTRHPWFVKATEALAAGDADDPYVGYYNFAREAATGYAPLGDTGWYYEERFAGGGMPDLNLDNLFNAAAEAFNTENWSRAMESSFTALLGMKYSMYENPIVCAYRDGKVSKGDLDKLSTCDVNAVINNGLSADSKEALKGKRGEDIVNADVAGQGYEATKAETDRKIEIQ